MGNDAKLRLAIRTVAVTTKVAVRSNRGTGHPELATATAERGLALLDSIGERLDAGTSSEILEALESARDELLQLLDVDQSVAISIGDDSALPEDLDVGPKLSS